MLACARRQQTATRLEHQTRSDMNLVVSVVIGVKRGCPRATRRRRKPWECPENCVSISQITVIGLSSYYIFTSSLIPMFQPWKSADPNIKPKLA